MISPEFYREEIRSGYLVDENHKRLWAVELDLLSKTIEVLEKHQLTYYAIGGTLLGAVRHQGFIPWDDDIDIILPRADYNRLLEIGPEAFQEPYFFQCVTTEKNFWRTHVQIRNSNTTGFIDHDRDRDINKGVFIDIFVLDEVPDTVADRENLQRKAERISRIANKAIDGEIDARHFFSRNTIKVLLSKILANCFGYNRLFYQYNRILAGFAGKGYHSRAHMTLQYHEGKCWEKSDFEESVKLPFEMMEINCPRGFSHILATQYGADYSDIPRIKPDTTHSRIIFDCNTPYKKFFDGEKERIL